MACQAPLALLALACDAELTSNLAEFGCRNGEGDMSKIV
jgi:hypothetical protein